jgi:hypothetical protein
VSGPSNGESTTAHVVSDAEAGRLADVGHPPSEATPSRGFARAVSLVLRGATVAAPWVTILRGDTSSRALSWLGLQRRRNPLRDVFAFGAGAFVGASIALVVAPTSGAELRARLRRPLDTRRARPPETNHVRPESAAVDHHDGKRGAS